jgi:Tol biopolymer transport system component
VYADAAWAPDWSPDGRRIAVLRFVGNPSGVLSLMDLVIVDLKTQTAESLGVRVQTDLNGVDWTSSDTLLINRYD